MSTTQHIVKDCRAQMEKGIDAAKREFASVRSGKASPSMLDSVKVEMYGQSMTLNQVANVCARAALPSRHAVRQGTDQGVEKAIRESGLGLDPASRAAIIRVPLPSMNEQRRKELAKVVHKYAEDGHIAVRHARTHAREALKKLGGVEDDVKHAEKELQKAHDEYIGKIDALMKAKEAEIMEV